MRETDIHPAMETLRQATKRWRRSRVDGSSSNGHDPFRVLISAMLRLHIRDLDIANDATERLLALAHTPQAMLQLPPAEIQETISMVEFSRPKTNHVLQVCKILVERYDGKVPDSREELMAMPGIGPKTASYIVIQAFNRPAICVDMNVHRITNRWGYVTTKSPEKTETVLRAKLPRDYWREISEQLSALGNLYCLPQWPKCLTCPVNSYCDRVGVVRSR